MMHLMPCHVVRYESHAVPHTRSPRQSITLSDPPRPSQLMPYVGEKEPSARADTRVRRAIFCLIVIEVSPIGRLRLAQGRVSPHECEHATCLSRYRIT